MRLGRIASTRHPTRGGICPEQRTSEPTAAEPLAWSTPSQQLCHRMTCEAVTDIPSTSTSASTTPAGVVHLCRIRLVHSRAIIDMGSPPLQIFTRFVVAQAGCYRLYHGSPRVRRRYKVPAAEAGASRVRDRRRAAGTRLPAGRTFQPRFLGRGRRAQSMLLELSPGDTEPPEN